jgi:GAF domain-containing protein
MLVDVGTRDAQALAGAFVELVHSLVDRFDVSDLLQVLCSRSMELLGASAVGLMVVDESGELRTVVSSSERVEYLELLQLQNQEGPCLDCFRSGGQVRAEDLGGFQERWPQFAPAALDAGFRSAYAVPMRLRGETIGGMNLFDSAPGAGGLRVSDLPLAQALADVASIALVQSRVGHRQEELTRQLQTALDSRVVIEQAKGMIAGELDMDLQAAFELLRSNARRTNRRLSELAEEVAAQRVAPASLRSVH